MTDDAMTVTFTVTGLERIQGHGRLLALAALEIEFDGVRLGLNGVQVIRQGKRISTQAPRFRNPKTGVWLPAVILPDELGAAIAREVQSMLLRRSGRTAQERSPSEVFTTPLDQLIEDSITEV
jgi:hypothetical protein